MGQEGKRGSWVLRNEVEGEGCQESLGDLFSITLDLYLTKDEGLVYGY